MAKRIWNSSEADTVYKQRAGCRLSRWRRRTLSRLSEAQNHRCCYCCGETFLADPHAKIPKGMSWDQKATIEHLIPQSEPIQTNKDENLFMACSLCNGLRGNYDALEFYHALRRNFYHELQMQRKKTNNEVSSSTKKPKIISPKNA